MQKPESVDENEPNNILWKFVKKRDHQILSRRPNLVTVIKENKHAVDWTLPYRSTTERKFEKTKNDCYLDLNRELKMLRNIKVTIGALGPISNVSVRGLEELDISRSKGDHLNYSIVEVGQITKKSLETWGDLMSIRLQRMAIS